MPFGITVTGDVFQRKLNQYFGQIEQVIVIADDHYGCWQSIQPEGP